MAEAVSFDSPAKRLFDILMSLVGLGLSLPLWPFVLLAIYLDDRGPVFFVQERCGKGGRMFRIVKFRTMRGIRKEGAPHDVINLPNDPRVTRAGRFLRATALDELPVLVNILKGDMSFVGPKPLPFRIEDTDRACYQNISQVPGYELRSQVRPGLTGMAQVYAPKHIDYRTKFEYDGLYLEKMSFWLDLKLILMSFWITFRGKWEHKGSKI